MIANADLSSSVDIRVMTFDANGYSKVSTYKSEATDESLKSLLCMGQQADSIICMDHLSHQHDLNFDFRKKAM